MNTFDRIQKAFDFSAETGLPKTRYSLKLETENGESVFSIPCRFVNGKELAIQIDAPTESIAKGQGRALTTQPIQTVHSGVKVIFRQNEGITSLAFLSETEGEKTVSLSPYWNVTKESAKIKAAKIAEKIIAGQALTTSETAFLAWAAADGSLGDIDD